MATTLGRSRVRSLGVVLAVSALTVVGTVAVVARTTTARAADAGLLAASTVEDEGADCPVPGSANVPATSRLPDPFRKIDGSRITSKNDWRCRRAEIKELAERTVYGQKPARPATVTGTVSSSGITVSVSDQGRTTSFSASVQLPTTGSAPYPAVVVIGGFGADTATIRSSGAAVISYDPLAVGREGTPRNNKQGAFYTLYGANSSTGILLAWAWGVSRIIDVIQQSGGNVLRADIGVTGCSRYGKGAFVTGAFDERIALTMPVESGSGGAPIFRGIPGESGAQPLSSAYGEQPWLGDAFNAYTGNPNSLPVDTHSTVAMIAPRGLFLMENPHIDWLAARSGSVAALAGAEVYRALDATNNITYWSDVTDGNHCATRNEWRTPMQQYIQKFLNNTGNPTGAMRISSRKQGNLAEWRDWQTPTLTDGPTTPPPTTPPPTTPPPTTPPPTTPPPTTPPPTTPPPTTPPPTTPPPTGACSASVSLNQWTGGFVATVRVTAGAAPVNGWTVSLTLPSGASVTNAWNSSRSGNSGTVQFTNVSYNGSIAAGQSTEFGFQGTGTGTGMTPTCAAR
ncbi:glucuronyl esterase domain-containing protein [Phytohabitans kaempferiae]|uniref:Cellulose binding domain-containing protein n=1 Tax=Phytohabitans kaempferiae TaxID=1620943 RepID=A0ABV6LZA0_9ACTN